MSNRIKIIVLCSLAIWLAQVLFAQKENIDSLRKIAGDEAQADSNRLKAMFTLGFTVYRSRVPDSALYFARLQYELALKAGIKKYQASALNVQGIIVSRTISSAKGRELLEKSLKLYTECGDKQGVANGLNNIGTIYKDEGDLAKALSYYIESLKIKEQIGDKNGEGSTLGNIGNIYEMERDYKKAIGYFLRSLRIREEIGNQKNVSVVLGNLGAVYSLLGDEALEKKDTALANGHYEIAFAYYARALAIKKEANDVRGIAGIINNMGNVLDRKGKRAEALKNYLESLAINQKLGDKNGEGLCLLNMAGIYSQQADSALVAGNKGFAMSKLAESIKTGERSIEILKNTGNLNLISRIAELLYRSYKSTGKYREAVTMHELYISTQDSLENESMHKEVMRQEMAYSYEKQKAVDEKENEKRLALSRQKEETQWVITFSVAGGLLLVLVFAVFAVNRLRLTSKQKMLIEQQKHLVDEKQKEILDSIYYARKIQRALITNEKYIAKRLRFLRQRA